MRKFILLILIGCITPYCSWSQDSLLAKNQAIKRAELPRLVIKGEELSRFPSANFLDVVNGLFPWAFSQTPDVNNFLFIVNGFVQQGINGISLYDIDEVVFTRNKLQNDFYPFSRAGTFYIKTKTTDSQKPVIRINSQYNSQWSKDLLVKFFPPNLTGVGATKTDISNSAGLMMRMIVYNRIDPW